MILYRITCILIGLSSFLAATFVVAEGFSVSGDFTNLPDYFHANPANRIQGESLDETELEKIFAVSGRVRELGRFTAIFDSEKHMQFTGGESGYVFLQGEAYFKRQKTAIATARLENRGGGLFGIHLEIFDEGIGRYTLKRPFRLVRLDFNVNSRGQVTGRRLQRGKKRPVRAAGCGTEQRLSSYLPGRTFNSVVAPASLKSVSIIIEGDTELQGQGKNLNSYLGTMMNMVDSWYKRDLGVTYQTTIVSGAQTYNSTTDYRNSDYTYYLHDEMRTKRPANSRTQYIHFLVTGKSNDEDLAGVVPDLATICRNKSDSIGFTVYYSDDETFNYETTAHEIGHLFAAEHDDSTTGNTGFLMNSGTNNVNSYVSKFSSQSKSEVSAHLNSNGSCLGTSDGDGDGGDEVDSYTVRLNNRARRRKLILVVRNDRGGRARNQPVAIRCGDYDDEITNEVKFGYTNRRGKLKFGYVRSELEYYCAGYVLNGNGDVLATSAIKENVGTKFPDDDFDDDYDDDDDWWDDDYWE